MSSFPDLVELFNETVRAATKSPIKKGLVPVKKGGGKNLMPARKLHERVNLARKNLQTH